MASMTKEEIMNDVSKRMGKWKSSFEKTRNEYLQNKDKKLLGVLNNKINGYYGELGNLMSQIGNDDTLIRNFFNQKLGELGIMERQVYYMNPDIFEGKVSNLMSNIQKKITICAGSTEDFSKTLEELESIVGKLVFLINRNTNGVGTDIFKNDDRFKATIEMALNSIPDLRKAISELKVKNDELKNGSGKGLNGNELLKRYLENLSRDFNNLLINYPDKKDELSSLKNSLLNLKGNNVGMVLAGFKELFLKDFNYDIEKGSVINNRKPRNTGGDGHVNANNVMLRKYLENLERDFDTISNNCTDDKKQVLNLFKGELSKLSGDLNEEELRFIRATFLREFSYDIEKGIFVSEKLERYLNNLERDFNDILSNCTSDDKKQTLVALRDKLSSLLNVGEEDLKFYRDAFLQEFNYDIERGIFNSRRTPGNNGSNNGTDSEYVALAATISMYIDDFQKNQPLIVNDGDIGSRSSREEKFYGYRTKLNKLLEEANNKSRSLDDIRNDFSKTQKLLSKDLKYEYNSKNKHRRRKVSRVRKAFLGLAGLGLGTWGISHLISRAIFFAKLGSPFTTFFPFVHPLAFSILGSILLIKSLSNKEKGIISRIIEKLKDKKNEVIDEDNISRRRR